MCMCVCVFRKVLFFVLFGLLDFFSEYCLIFKALSPTHPVERHYFYRDILILSKDMRMWKYHIFFTAFSYYKVVFSVLAPGIQS